MFHGRPLRVDQLASLAGVVEGQELGTGDLRKVGIAVEDVAVVERELHRLGEGVEGVGRARAHGLQVEARKQVQSLEHDGPLGPEAGLVDFVAAIGDVNGLFDSSLERREILLREDPSGFSRGLHQAAAHVATIEDGPPRCDRLQSILRLAKLGRIRGGDGPERAGEVGLPKHLPDFEHTAARVVDRHGRGIGLAVLPLAQQGVPQHVVHREAIGQLDRGCEHLG
jgi:hypothetical protein